MKKIFWILCLTLYPAIASATNFDVCVNEAKTNHNDTTAEGYTSYKCESTTAEKLSARPDECAGGPKPSLRSLTRKTRQLDDGVYMSLSWTAGKCAGSCETRSYDSKDTTYLCEVRVYGDEGRPAVESGSDRLAPGPGAPGPGPLRPGRPGPGGPGPSSPGPGGPEAGGPPPPPPAGPDAGGPGGGGRQANELRLRRRPLGPGWSPPPPRRYSHRYSRYSHRPGFSRRSWFEPQPPDPYYEEYRPQPRCDCN
jgi:hypothetical protein